MNLKDILAISGESGLFKFIAQGKNAVIVEHLETKKRMAAHGTAKVSTLEDIPIFTDEEEVPISRVFDLIWDKESGKEAISHKSSNQDLLGYFAEVLPNFDREKVYPSDVRKVLNWYNILQRLDLLVKEVEDENVPEEEKEADETLKAAKAGKPAGKGKAPAKEKVGEAKKDPNISKGGATRTKKS